MPVLLVAQRDGTVKIRVNLAGRRKLTIGRSSRCDLRLESGAISRRHALLFEHAGRWHIVDTGSRTGLYGGRERSHHLIPEPGEWARLGPAYLWLLDGAGERLDRVATGRNGRLRLVRDRPDEPGTGIDLDGLAGVTDAAAAPPQAGPVLVAADAAGSAFDRVVLADTDLVTVGRGASCDLVLHDRAVSRLHCVLYREHSGWCVANAAPASNGTRVGGRPSPRRRLTNELPVRIGHSILWLEARGGEGNEEAGSSGGDTSMAHEPVKAESAFFDGPGDVVEPQAAG